MKKALLKVLCIGLLAVFVGGITGSTTRAEDKPTAADAGKEKKDAKSRALPFHGKVAKVDKDAQSVTLEGKKQKTLVITGKTHITKDEQKATLEDVKAGEEVRGSARENNGKWEAASLTIGAKAKGEKKAK